VRPVACIQGLCDCCPFLDENCPAASLLRLSSRRSFGCATATGAEIQAHFRGAPERQIAEPHAASSSGNAIRPSPVPSQLADMIKNLPVKTLKHRELTIEGYSRAAVQTYWRVPELKLGFDLGAHPWSFMGTSTWFVTHTHLDHIAALPVYVARRRMMKMEPPTIYLPEEAIPPLQQILRYFTRLDRGRLPCTMVGVKPGDEIEISREHVVTATATKHTVPSLGYIVWERRRKLKPEYLELPGEKIRDLRLSGTEITEERRIPLVAYLGDSAPEGLDRCPDMYEAEVLILEMTFVAPGHRKERIHKFGHIHLDDVIERRDRFRNQRIIAAHFSTRYHARRIREIVGKALPDMLDDRLYLWL
jgi:ribonuclease Z